MTLFKAFPNKEGVYSCVVLIRFKINRPQTVLLVQFQNNFNMKIIKYINSCYIFLHFIEDLACQQRTNLALTVPNMVPQKLNFV